MSSGCVAFPRFALPADACNATLLGYCLLQAGLPYKCSHFSFLASLKLLCTALPCPGRRSTVCFFPLVSSSREEVQFDLFPTVVATVCVCLEVFLFARPPALLCPPACLLCRVYTWMYTGGAELSLTVVPPSLPPSRVNSAHSLPHALIIGVPAYLKLRGKEEATKDSVSRRGSLLCRVCSLTRV